MNFIIKNVCICGTVHSEHDNPLRGTGKKKNAKN